VTEALTVLSNWAAEHADWPTPKTLDGILRATFARATKTFNAAVLLTDQGYGPQAGMLARSLFEDMLVAYWMTFCADEAWVRRRIDDRMQFGRLLMRETALKHRWEIRPEEDIPEADMRKLREDEPRYAATFGPFGDVSWWAATDVHQKTTKKGEAGKWVAGGRRQLVGLVRALDAHPGREGGPFDQVVGQRPDEGEHTTLRRMYDIAHNFNNMMLHHSPFSMELHVYGEAGGNPDTWNEEPSDQWVAQIQLCLFWTYGQLILLMCQTLNPDLVDEAIELFERTLSSAFDQRASGAPDER